MRSLVKRKLEALLTDRGFRKSGSFYSRHRSDMLDVAQIRHTRNGYMTSLGVVDEEFGATVSQDGYTWSVLAEPTAFIKDVWEFLRMSDENNKVSVDARDEYFQNTVGPAIDAFFNQFPNVQEVRKFVADDERSPKGAYSDYYLDWVLGKGPKWPDTPAAQP
ncbi:MAG: hypothetical protein JNM34_06170 [Chthonomonadaceae bacterium]|nr:hypothetical protein [Chthonomonadaceae bacterium]